MYGPFDMSICTASLTKTKQVIICKTNFKNSHIQVVKDPLDIVSTLGKKRTS